MKSFLSATTSNLLDATVKSTLWGVLTGREVDLRNVAKGLADVERGGAARVGEDEERPALPGPLQHDLLEAPADCQRHPWKVIKFQVWRWGGTVCLRRQRRPQAASSSHLQIANIGIYQ